MKLFTLSLLGLLLTSCAITPPLSPEQRRSMQTHTFEETSYDNVFHAVKSVMQDDGYVIKNQDFQGGLIVGTIQRSNGGAQWISFGPPAQQAQDNVVNNVHEVSVSLEKINEKTIETRVTVQEIDQYRLGSQRGNVIVTPETYNTFYQKLAREVERRKAQGKG